MIAQIPIFSLIKILIHDMKTSLFLMSLDVTITHHINHIAK